MLVAQLDGSEGGKWANALSICMTLQALDGEQMIECIKKLLTLDADWIPTDDGYSMYLRPTAIGTHPFLGVSRSDRVKVFVIASPVGKHNLAWHFGFCSGCFRAHAFTLWLALTMSRPCLACRPLLPLGIQARHTFR